MATLNAIGLSLQFLAFWFAAPELLGPTTLKRMERSLQKLIAHIPVLLLLSGMLAYGITFSVLGFTKGLEAGSEGISDMELRNYFITIGVFTLLYFVVILFYKRLKSWLDQRVARPLMERLISSNQTRTIALATGAVLFTCGFVCQLIATFLG